MVQKAIRRVMRQPRAREVKSSPVTVSRNILVPPAQPYAIPYPKGKDRCAWSGYTRALLVTITVPLKRNDFKPPVRTVSLKEPGQKRASRMIVLQSLFDFMKNHEEGGEQKAA
jgi:hypothetical protein